MYISLTNTIGAIKRAVSSVVTLYSSYVARMAAENYTLDTNSCVETAIDALSPEPILALIPSAYKLDKVGSVLPTNGSGDFVLTRSTAGTRVDSSGVIETMVIDTPRINHTDNNCPILLIEPQSTNLLDYALDIPVRFSDVRSTYSQGILSLDGASYSEELTEDSSNSTHYSHENAGVTSGITYTFSAYIKSNGRSWMQLSFSNDGYYFDLTNKVVGSSVGSPISYEITEMSGGWLRLSITAIASSTTGRCQISMADSDGGDVYQGDGVSSLYWWGVQLEEQTSVTSFIPTNGTIVTRTADICQVTPPVGVVSITETIGGVEQTPITTIPTTYTIPNGNINKVIMES
jgi:hypothetical protein